MGRVLTLKGLTRDPALQLIAIRNRAELSNTTDVGHQALLWVIGPTLRGALMVRTETEPSSVDPRQQST